MRKRFNIRVYGLWLQDNAVLVSTETINGSTIIKFPGGGLEWGEGAADCLKREWMEELKTAVEIQDHYYTTDFFQPSAYDDSQVISIYYRVQPLSGVQIPQNNGNELFSWLPISAHLSDRISLPIDKVVAQMLYADSTRNATD
jgi:8-oxo-dGTP diphosphatase